jgi:hypothetical protein
MSKQTLANTNEVPVSIDFITQQMLNVKGLKSFRAKTGRIAGYRTFKPLLLLHATALWW